MKKLTAFIILIFISGLFYACGDGEISFKEQGPLKYRFLSSVKVEVIYAGKNYIMNRYGDNNVPFRYDFEDDGDLNIYIAGVAYDLDSPYDIEVKKKKKKKKTNTYAAKKKVKKEKKKFKKKKYNTKDKKKKKNTY